MYYVKRNACRRRQVAIFLKKPIQNIFFYLLQLAISAKESPHNAIIAYFFFQFSEQVVLDYVLVLPELVPLLELFLEN